jgi:hypothetical protein
VKKFISLFIFMLDPCLAVSDVKVVICCWLDFTELNISPGYISNTEPHTSYMFVEYNMRIAQRFKSIRDTINYLKLASAIEAGDKIFTIYTSLTKGEFI